MPLMSLRAYAKHRGVSLAAVQKALQSGRIRIGADGKLDAAAADADWSRNTKLATAHVLPDPRRSMPEQDDSSGFGGNQYAKARAIREHYLARLAKIEYEERVGKLVSKDEVQVAAFTRFRQFRDLMLNIPDRLAAVLAAESDAAACHHILASEIRKALHEFADSDH